MGNQPQRAKKGTTPTWPSFALTLAVEDRTAEVVDAIGSVFHDRLIFSEPIPNRLVATHVACVESDAPKIRRPASAFVDPRASLLTTKYIGGYEPHCYDDEVHGNPLQCQQHLSDWRVSNHLQQGNSQ